MRTRSRRGVASPGEADASRPPRRDTRHLCVRTALRQELDAGGFRVWKLDRLSRL